MDTNKILIIANIRCGGTTLLRSLASNYKCPAIFEPTKLEDFGNHVVVKANAAQHKVEDLLTYSEKFDSVILLDRKNKEEQIQSATWMFHHNTSNVKWKWNKKLEGTPANEKAIYEVGVHTENLGIISEKLGIEITYYEDIYFGEVLVNGFSPQISKKLRQEDTKKIII